MRGADISQRHCRAIALSLHSSKWGRERGEGIGVTHMCIL
tara:strand:+ start:130 stop:249 length:120 start_codon:yes stop_codon:yes gene_type:complete